MILNIPVKVDDTALEKKLDEQVMDEVNNYIHKLVDNEIMERNAGYLRKTRDQGLRELIRNRIDEYFEDHKEVIIEAAAERIAERAGRTKKVKEAVNDIS